jgi:hypothetical protein
LTYQISQTGKSPKDVLVEFWDNLFGFLPTKKHLFGSVAAFFEKQTEKSMLL